MTLFDADRLCMGSQAVRKLSTRLSDFYLNEGGWC